MGGQWRLHRLGKDLFVNTCEALPFGDFQGIMWQEWKGKDVSEALGT